MTQRIEDAFLGIVSSFGDQQREEEEEGGGDGDNTQGLIARVIKVSLELYNVVV